MATVPFRNFIAGEWVAGATATVNRNPSDLGDVIGEYAQADAAQARAGIAAAKQAFAAWAGGNIQERANILDRAGTEILARKDELGRLLSREEGKTLPEGVGEARPVADNATPEGRANNRRVEIIVQPVEKR